MSPFCHSAPINQVDVGAECQKAVKMACYNPFVMLFDTSSQPKKLLDVLKGSKEEGLDYEFFENMNELYRGKGIQKEYMKIPCGKCIGCKEAKSKSWATRCSLEAEQWEQNYFVTLTYNDEHLPREDELINKKTGEVFQNDNWEQGHLVKEELQEFMKDLRAYWKYHYNHDNIRFFSCGEYGGSIDGTHRPHYHLILFNLPRPTWELQIRKIDADGNIHWTHEGIEKCWMDKRYPGQNISKGFVDICEVNWDTCAYVARYTVKKEGGKKTDEWYFEQGKTPEFINMSRKPGIGLDFFSKNFQDIYKNDEIIIKGHREKIQPVKPPAYYDKRYDLINPQLMRRIKNDRKRMALYATRSKNAQSSLPEWERLRAEEHLKKCKMKKKHID